MASFHTCFTVGPIQLFNFFYQRAPCMEYGSPRILCALPTRYSYLNLMTLAFIRVPNLVQNGGAKIWKIFAELLRLRRRRRTNAFCAIFSLPLSLSILAENRKFSPDFLFPKVVVLLLLLRTKSFPTKNLLSQISWTGLLLLLLLAAVFPTSKQAPDVNMVSAHNIFFSLSLVHPCTYRHTSTNTHIPTHMHLHTKTYANIPKAIYILIKAQDHTPKSIYLLIKAYAHTPKSIYLLIKAQAHTPKPIYLHEHPCTYTPAHKSLHSCTYTYILTLIYQHIEAYAHTPTPMQLHTGHCSNTCTHIPTHIHWHYVELISLSVQTNISLPSPLCHTPTK